MTTLANCVARAISWPAVPEVAQKLLLSFDHPAFWRSTLAVSAYAQTLARALDLDQDLARMGGLGGLILRSGILLVALVVLVVLVTLVTPEGYEDIQQRAIEPDSRIG